MSRRTPAWSFMFLLVLLAVFGGLELARGGLYISKHEGDTLHLLDVVIRMAAGERIHQDFTTPIGVLAFAPIVWFLKAGEGAGHALIHAQVAVAAVLLPAIWWAVASRLSGVAAWLAGGYMVILTLALTYGEAQESLSMSMHYNRWAWTIAYVVVLLALLPNRWRPAPMLDGALIGLGLAALVLLKVTFFVALAPAVALALVATRSWRALAVALAAGLLVAVAVTLAAGIGFWTGYVADLRTVSASANRQMPGAPLGSVLAAPPFLGVNLVLLFSVIQLRHAGRMTEGLLLLILAPGLVYITYQNFGNDPQWLILLVAILWMLRPEPGMANARGWDLRQVFHLLIAAALAFAAPSFLNLAYSPFRHLSLDASEYVPLVLYRTQDADLQTPRLRAHHVDAKVGQDGPGSPLAAFRKDAERTTLVSINGSEVPDCELAVGIGAWYGTMAGELTAAGFAGRRIFEADVFNVLYLFGDFPRLRGASPWYYGGAPGLEDAELVLVPDCPIGGKARKSKLDAIAAAGVGLAEIHRGGLYTLYEKVTVPQAPGG